MEGDFMKHRAVVIVLCLLAPVIYLVFAFATDAALPVVQREMPPPAGLVEQKEFEAMKNDVINHMDVPTPESDPLPTYDALPEITIDKPDNVDEYKNAINKKAKEITENAEKTTKAITDKIDTWVLPDTEEQALPEQEEIKMPSVNGIKGESMPPLPSFAEIAAMLPEFTLPDISEILPKIQQIEIPTISIPDMEIPTLPPMKDLEVPELEELPKPEVPEIFKNNE
jgi:hypothetical protein